MTVEDTKTRRAALAVAEAPIVSNGRHLESAALAGALRRISGEGPRFAAVAPVGMDIMGGFGEYAGGLVLCIPLGAHVCAAAQRRGDGLFCLWATSRAPDVAFEVPVERLFPGGRPANAADCNELFRDERCSIAQCVIGALLEGVRAGILPPFPKGLTLSLAPHPDLTADRCLAHAVCAAVFSAARGALDGSFEAGQAAAAYERVACDWLLAGPCRAEVLFALSGECNAINQLRTDTFQLSGTVPVPEGIELLGIDSGALRDDMGERHEAVRVASFMGRLLIEKIIRYERHSHIPWDGFLSRISSTDYVDHFRDRLPTRLSGDEFLSRFKDVGDPYSSVNPEEIYRIRSRTEHHIYEHARACEFVECIARYDRKTEDRTLKKAGELMYASHWSYGQRCGLASPETDLLVKLIRQHGENAGIFGAKLTGRGCGGIVAVLMRNNDRAETAVNRAMEDYANATGRAPRLLRGSLPGSLLTGPRPL